MWIRDGAYRASGSGPWIRVKKGVDIVEREVKTLQLLCATIPHEACAAYDERAGRETFREFYSQCDLQFRATTSGVEGARSSPLRVARGLSSVRDGDRTDVCSKACEYVPGALFLVLRIGNAAWWQAPLR